MKSTVAAPGEALYQQGLVLYRQMRFDEASLLCDKVLEMQPGHAHALHVSGLIALRRGSPSRAVELIGKARNIEPQNAEMHTDHGLAQLQLQQFSVALTSFDRAIAVNPQFPSAHHWRGTVLLVLQQYDAAVASYEKAIALKYKTAGGFYNLGSAQFALKRYERAIASFDRAIALKPDHADAHTNRGLALYELGRYEAVVASCDSALAVKPDHVGALNNRGNALHQLRRYEAAIASYERAIVIEPDNEKSHANLAQTLQELDRREDALASYDKAIAINPGFVGAHADRADTLTKFKRYDAAINGYDRAFALEPDRPFLAGKRHYARLQVCDWGDFESEGTRLAAAAAEGKAVVPPFQGLAMFGSAAVQRQVSQTWVRQLPNRTALSAIPLRSAGGKIRIGYFSGDFRDHPVGILAAEVFELHDRTRFEVFAFSFGNDKPDSVRNRLKRAFDHFIDVSARSDQDIALLARSLGIDIAVDLGGFTQGGKTSMFALRAAPLQIGYLGYAGTTGADFMDYLVADRTVIPVEARERYAEKIIHLPNSFMPHDSQRTVAEPVPSRTALGLPATGFVFCCFNNTYKITPSRFGTWMRILARVDGSVLWLSESNERACANLRREASSRNVDPARLIFAKRHPSQPEHLARHRAADLFIDTLPYNAHATAIDALWTGLPVLTLSGEAFAARVAASLLRAVGLPELIVATESEYEELAVALARDAPRFDQLKQTLALNRSNAPLFDSRRYTRDLEAAYSMIGERYWRGLPAEHIEV